jgi:tetratricopeptide (TPR) repeat protein
MRRGDLDRAVAQGRRGAEAWKPSGPWSHVGTYIESIGLFLKGEWDRAAEVYAPAIRDFPDDNQWTGAFSAWELLLHAYRGTGAALELFRNREDRMPGVESTAVAGERFFAMNAIEALAVVGSLETAAALYPVALETVEGGFVADYSGLTQRSLGISAACGQQWDVAERHFRTALAEAHGIPFRTEQPEVRRWHAWMLLRRGGPGDREEAHRLLHEAIRMFEQIGMVKHAALARTMLG